MSTVLSKEEIFNKVKKEKNDKTRNQIFSAFEENQLYYETILEAMEAYHQQFSLQGQDQIKNCLNFILANPFDVHIVEQKAKEALDILNK